RPANVLAKDEHPRISSQRIADAEHYRFKKSVPFAVERSDRFELRHRPRHTASGAIGVQHIDAAAWHFALEDSDTDTLGRRPLGRNDELRPRFSGLLRLAFPVLDGRRISQPSAC